jgi:hypothetical protein
MGASTCLAQTEGAAFAVRIESREVVVPVLVADRSHIYQFKTYSKYGIGIGGLNANDFHILEDGIEQPIQNVVAEQFRSLWVVDNISAHVESSCTPKGVWNGPDIPLTWGSSFER